MTLKCRTRAYEGQENERGRRGKTVIKHNGKRQFFYSRKSLPIFFYNEAGFSKE